MITMPDMYWFTRLDSIKTALELMGFLFIVCGLGFFGCYIAMNFEDDLTEKGMRIFKMLKRLSWLLVVGILLPITSVFIPSKKDMALIYIVPKIANSELVQGIPEELKELYGCFKEYVKELTKK